MTKEPYPWSTTIDPDVPPQRFVWKTGIHRPKYGALIWSSAHEMWEAWFNGHFEQIVIPDYAARGGPEHVSMWLMSYLMGRERFHGMKFSFRMLDFDVFNFQRKVG